MFKLLAAMLIASALFLPLSSCSEYRFANGQMVGYVDANGMATPLSVQPQGAITIEKYVQSNKLPAGISKIKQYHYFYKSLSKTDHESWLALFAFIWPAGMVLAWKTAQRHSVQRYSRLLTPALLFLTGYELFGYSYYGVPEIGYYMAFIGILILSLYSAKDCASILAIRKPYLGPKMKAGIFVTIPLVALSYPLFGLVMQFLPRP
jgi:hypothetical protein